MKKHILLIDDDSSATGRLRASLTGAGAQVSSASTGAAGLAALWASRVDLVLIGDTRQDAGGVETCRRIRSRDACLPIILLTGGDGGARRLAGFEAGADDCLSLPVNTIELVARVRALLRRTEAAAWPPASTVVSFGGLRIDFARREVFSNGHEARLTTKEFELLAHLSRAPGRVYSREQLLQALWGGDFHGYEHTINSHINRLRAKIEDEPGNPQYIRTVWGIGYKFDSTHASLAIRPNSSLLAAAV